MLQNIMIAPKYHSAIGRLYIEKGNEAALKVVDKLRTLTPIFNDYEKMGEFYKQYKAMKVLENISYNDKKIFIAAIVLMYNPEWYAFPVEYLIKARGFSQAISLAMDYNKKYVSQVIRQVVFEMNHYEDVKKHVEQVVELLKLTA